MADQRDTYTLEALLTGNNSRLKKVVDQAVKMLERLENRKSDDIKIDGDVAPLEKKVETAKKMTEALDGKKAQIDIIARNAEAIKNMQRVRLTAKQLSSQKPKVNVEVETSAAEAKVSVFKKILKSIPNKIKVHATVDADTNKFASAWRAVQNANNRFQGDMDELANSIRAFGTVGANVIKGSLLSSFTALVPVIATLVPAIMAVGNAIGVVGGGALGLVGSFAIAGGGIAAFATLATSAYKMYKDGAIQASAETAAFETALSGLKTQWQTLVQDNASSIFTTMANGINIAKSALSGLTPFINGVVGSMEKMSASVLEWSESSSVAKAFFDMMGTTGVSVFDNIMAAAGRFGSGLISLFTQFGPLFEWTAQGFANMGAQFDAWSQKVSTSEGIQKFISYVQTNLPLIGQIFGDTFMGIFNLFAAFSGNSQTIFTSLAQMAEQFRAWSETIAQSDGFQKFIEYVQTNGPVVMSTIGSIIGAIVNFAIAIAPIGQKVLELVSGFAEWTAKMLEAHPIVGQIIGVAITLMGIFMQLAPVLDFIKVGFGLLSGAIGMISAPVWIIIGVITILIGTFVYLWQTNEDFRNKVIAIWEEIKSYLSQAIQAISDFVMQIWGQLVAWWNENNELIMQTATRIWDTILTVIQTAMQILVPIVQTAWELIKGAIQIAVDLILGIVKVGMQLLNGDWSGAWETVKQTASQVWEAIKQTISNIIDIILPIISRFVEQAYQWISQKFEAAKQFVQIAWEGIKQAISSKAQEILSDIQNKFESIKSAIQSKIDAAKSALINGFNNMVSSAINFASQLVARISEAMSNFVSRITSGASNALSALSSGLSAMVSAAAGFVGEMTSAGVNLIMGMVNGITSAAGNLVSAAVSAVKGAIGAAKAALGIHSPSRVFKKIGGYTVEGMVIGIMRSVPDVINASRKMATAAIKGLDKMKTASYEKAKQGSKAFYSAMSDASANAAKKISANNKKIASIQQKLKGRILNTTRANLNKQLAGLKKENSAYTAQRKVIDGLKTSLKKSTSQLASIAKKRETVAESLKKAQGNLKAVTKERLDFRNSIADDGKSLGSVASSNSTTAPGLVADMRARYKAVKNYAKNINALKKKGVDKNIIRDLLEAGISGGADQARILANANADVIKQVNYYQKLINNSANGLASKQAKEFYDVGVNAAKGVVRGLQAKDKALIAASNHIANTITKTVKKKLGIHSPSRVMAVLGGHTIGGFIVGVKDQTNSAVRTMSGLATKVSDAFTPRFTGVPTIADSVSKATSNVATQVNADVVNTVRSEPVGVTLNANFALGNRDYNAFVGDITDKQNTSVRLEEVYDV